MTLVGDAAVGVASSLLWEALKRPIEGVIAEFRRHDQVGRPLHGRATLKSDTDAALVNKIVDDFNRVISNGTGKLTQEVALFIRDLRATIIPEAIAHAALSGVCSNNLRSSFSEFHSRYDGIPFTSDQLFDSLYEACLSRVESVKDRTLLDIIRAQHASIISRVEGIAHSLSKGMQESINTNPDEIRDARIRLARSIQNEHKYVSVESLRGPKKVSLKSIAIPSRLAVLNSSHVASAKMPADMPTQSYLSFRRRFSRAVVVGDPGGGKSTLTQMLSADLARLILSDAVGQAVRQIEDRDLQLPLRIILRRYESRAAKTSSYSLLDHLRDDLKIALDGDERLANGYLASALGSGEAMVIFDGLDEVLDVGARAHMVELIEQFSATYPGCPVLVTSRLVGYRDAPLNDEFMIFGLDRFNRDEIQKYSEKAIATVGLVKKEEAVRKAKDFFAQSSKIGSDLRENPLMLGLMVQIYLVRGDVPGNRPEVYKECATLMFEKWDGRRQIIADVPRQDIELLDVFGYVASRTFGDATSEEGVTRGWLIAELRKHFSDWYVDQASANRAARSLVDFLTGRAWVMSEVGQGTFKFTHRTFLEYFFARHLISESKSIDDLIRIDLIPKVITNQWVVISHLALHMAVFRDGGKSRQAADTIESLLSSPSYPSNQELAFLRFVAATLPYLTIPEASFVRISKVCVERAIALGAYADVSALNVIDMLLTSSTSRDHLVRDEVYSQLSDALSGSKSAELLFAMYAIGRGGGVQANLNRHAASGSRMPWAGIDRVSDRYRDHLFELAKDNADLARAFVYLYREERVSLYKFLGRSFIQSSPSALVPAAVDGLIFSAVRISVGSYRKKAAPNLGVEDAKVFVSELAKGILGGEIELHRLLMPGRMKGREVDARIEEAFREIWISTQASRRVRNFSRLEAECLLCVVDTIESFEGGDERRVDMFHAVPVEAIAQMVRHVDDPEIRPWLDHWLARTLPRARSARQRVREDSAV